MDDRQRAVATVGTEDEATRSIVLSRIRSFTDRDPRHRMSGRGIGDGHHLIVTDGIQVPAGAVEGKARGTVASVEGPGGLQLGRRNVDAHELTGLRLDIGIDVTMTIRLREFRLARNGDGAQKIQCGGIQHRHVVALAVEGQQTMRALIVDDCVGVLAMGRDGARGGQRRIVEFGDRIPRTIAEEAAIQVRCQRNAVGTTFPGDRTYDFSCLGIDDVGTVAARHEQAVTRRVHRQVIPTAGTAHRPTIDHRVGLRCGTCCIDGRRPAERQHGRAGNPNDPTLTCTHEITPEIRHG